MSATSLLNSRVDRTPGFAYKLADEQYGMDVVYSGEMDISTGDMSVCLPFADGNRRDGVGDLLEIGGIDLSRHTKNPVSLFDHGKQIQLPIGLCEDPRNSEYTVRIDPMTKMATARVFFYQGNGTLNGLGKEMEGNHALFCEQLFDLVAKRFVRGGSIGYLVKQAREIPPDYQTGVPQGLHLINVLMLEASVVVMPANQDTVRKALGMKQVCGKPLSPYLVKCLTPYAGTRKAQLGYERKYTPQWANEMGRSQEQPHFVNHFLTEDGKPKFSRHPQAAQTEDAHHNHNQEPFVETMPDEEPEQPQEKDLTAIRNKYKSVPQEIGKPSERQKERATHGGWQGDVIDPDLALSGDDDYLADGPQESEVGEQEDPSTYQHSVKGGFLKNRLRLRGKSAELAPNNEWTAPKKLGGPNLNRNTTHLTHKPTVGLRKPGKNKQTARGEKALKPNEYQDEIRRKVNHHGEMVRAGGASPAVTGMERAQRAEELVGRDVDNDFLQENPDSELARRIRAARGQKSTKPTQSSLAQSNSPDKEWAEERKNPSGPISDEQYERVEHELNHRGGPETTEQYNQRNGIKAVLAQSADTLCQLGKVLSVLQGDKSVPQEVGKPNERERHHVRDRHPDYHTARHVEAPQGWEYAPGGTDEDVGEDEKGMEPTEEEQTPYEQEREQSALRRIHANLRGNRDYINRGGPPSQRPERKERHEEYRKDDAAARKRILRQEHATKGMEPTEQELLQETARVRKSAHEATLPPVVQGRRQARHQRALQGERHAERQVPAPQPSAGQLRKMKARQSIRSLLKPEGGHSK